MNTRIDCPAVAAMVGLEALVERANAPESLSVVLLNEFQHDFPLVERPYEALSEQVSASPQQVLATLSKLTNDGAIQRIGAVFRPNAIGRSLLAAMTVPEAQLPHVAARVSAYAGVNHNYARDHAVNLWFVATAHDAATLDCLIASIEADTGFPVLRLPLLAQYHIDLGFDLRRAGAAKRVTPGAQVSATLTDQQWHLVHALEFGLPLVATPYAVLGAQADMTQAQVLATLREWIATGVIQRFGVIVRHYELGFRANAMAVWDIPDDVVDRIGTALACEPAVTLCYRRERAGARERRARRAPAWPYNLYCMVHGRERGAVTEQLAHLSARHALGRFPRAVLFSTQRFKQMGAHYAGSATEAPVGSA
jgi:DNA-binding Lrp family transcriptional regulator